MGLSPPSLSCKTFTPPPSSVDGPERPFPSPSTSLTKTFLGLRFVAFVCPGSYNNWHCLRSSCSAGTVMFLAQIPLDWESVLYLAGLCGAPARPLQPNCQQRPSHPSKTSDSHGRAWGSQLRLSSLTRSASEGAIFKHLVLILFATKN